MNLGMKNKKHITVNQIMSSRFSAVLCGSLRHKKVTRRYTEKTRSYAEVCSIGKSIDRSFVTLLHKRGKILIFCVLCHFLSVFLFFCYKKGLDYVN